MRHAILTALALALLSAPAQATTHNVPVPYPTIQKAMDAASSGDTVLVAAGTYNDCTHPSEETAKTVTCVLMKPGVVLRGSGSEVTTIDAELKGIGVYCKDVTDGVIEGFTLINADDELGGWPYAPGIFCRNSSLQIQDCDIGPNYDGGIYCIETSAPTVQDCVFSGNTAKSGGGIHVEDNSSPTVQDCEFNGNEAPIGGAILALNSSPTIERCEITNNQVPGAGNNGGGLLAQGSTLVIRHCLFSGNVTGGSGGGLFYTESGGEITACTIQNNDAAGDFGRGGGVSFTNGSTATMDSCVIVKNAASGDPSNGGGISIRGGSDVTITNCTVAQNSITGGGSKARGGASGIAIQSSNPTIERTIVAFNSVGVGLECDSAVPTVTCCDVFGNAGGNALCGIDGGGNFSQDPVFCDTLTFDYHLEAESPCAPGNHPAGADTCGGALIGGLSTGCLGAVEDDGYRITRSPLLAKTTPNPFNRTTTIVFGLTEPARVTLRVYDVTGREVASLRDRPMSVGTHRVTWDGTTTLGTRASSGIYFYRLTVGDRMHTGRMVMVN